MGDKSHPISYPGTKSCCMASAWCCTPCGMPAALLNPDWGEEIWGGWGRDSESPDLVPVRCATALLQPLG